MNKTDLPQVVDKTELFRLLPEAEKVEAAIADDIGIEKIEDVVEALVYGGKVSQSGQLMVTNVRHKALLEESEASLGDAIQMAEKMQPLEFLEIDVNSAYESLGAIIGESVQEDIINEVFARFCLGK